MRSILPALVIALTASAHRAAADPDADARALVDRWLAAQNQGRFDDYAAIYADTFLGTKRVGATTRTMDRAAWLKDRKAMFRAPMTVAATDVKVTAAAGAIVVELTQTWRQGDFADLGHKRLTLDPAGARILAEEMLDSHVLLTEGACLGAIYPGASWARRTNGAADLDRKVLGVSVLDLGARSICQVDVQGNDEVHVTVAAFTFAKRWTRGGSVDLSYAKEPGPDQGEISGAVSVTPLALGAGELAIDVTRGTLATGPMLDDSHAEHTIYRVMATDLVELLAYESSVSGGEEETTDRCELTIEPKVRRGWHDLTVECTHTQSSWHGQDPVDDTTETRRYRWDGATYVVK
jgi:hypothetical protein